MRNRRDRARRGRIIARRAARTSLLTEDVERGIVSQELIYTSVPRGLKPGSNGFCTVACTRGMSANLVQQLESLSGYRHIYPPQDPQARLNPIAFSHLVIAVAGRNWHVLSRICDAGLDYTQRTNKFAHHVVLDAAETPAGGPAWLLAGSGFMRSTWEGEPCNFPSGPAIPAGQSPPRVCRAWQQLTGDAGWGGVLAETVAGPVGRQAVLVFPPGTDMLTLLAESLALLPAELRWRVTFSTYFTKLPPGIACQWRCVADGTPEAAAARRGPPTALVIDLCRPLGPAAGGTYVEAARTGRMPRAVPATAAGPAEIGLDLAFRTDAQARREGTGLPSPADAGAGEYPVSSSRATAVARPPAYREFRPRAKQPRRWPWLFAIAALLLIVVGGGVAVWLAQGGRKQLSNNAPAPPAKPQPQRKPETTKADQAKANPSGRLGGQRRSTGEGNVIPTERATAKPSQAAAQSKEKAATTIPRHPPTPKATPERARDCGTTKGPGGGQGTPPPPDPAPTPPRQESQLPESIYIPKLEPSNKLGGDVPDEKLIRKIPQGYKITPKINLIGGDCVLSDGRKFTVRSPEANMWTLQLEDSRSAGGLNR